MFPEIYFYDFYLGSLKDQAPTAWVPLLIKLPALSYENALGALEPLGINRAKVARVVRHMVKSRRGNTVVQFKELDFKDNHVVTPGVQGQH